jgi:MoxR-like ATPase
MAEAVDPVELTGKKPRTTAPLKVDLAVDELITDGAHFLQMTKKDLVGAAVRMYVEARREEMRAAMLEKMARLDGSAEADIAMLTGIPPEKTRELGGTGEDS